MAGNIPHTPPSSPDGDGGQAVKKARTARRSALVLVTLAVVVVVVVLAWRPAARHQAAPIVANEIADTNAEPDAITESTPRARATRHTDSSYEVDSEPPNDDPNDLANHIRPGDPEPTGAEVIGALHDLGIHTGIGAFNPPGTSPPLEGLAVPENYELPKGYVRHYQSTDEGEPIEPILMYSPEVTLRDANGRPVAMPADRVVPIDRAPPGLPVRWVSIPRP